MKGFEFLRILILLSLSPQPSALSPSALSPSALSSSARLAFLPNCPQPLGPSATQPLGRSTLSPSSPPASLPVTQRLAVAPLGALWPRALGPWSHWRPSTAAPQFLGRKRLVCNVQTRDSEQSEEGNSVIDVEVKASETTGSSAPSAELKLAELRANLQVFIDREAYAEAAVVQNRIKELEAALGMTADPLTRRPSAPASLSPAVDVVELSENVGPMHVYKSRKLATKPKMVLEEAERVRNDEEPDCFFYDKPRMAVHVDMDFAVKLQELYAKRIMRGAAVLDLGASCASYLPEDQNYREVTGIGMNMEEMEANSDLTGRIVCDLNEVPELPFEDERFDAVICASSVQYFTNPEAVLNEASRVLRPGGIIIISFTDKCFESKVPLAWKSRSNLGRCHLIQEVVRTAGYIEPELIWKVHPLSSLGVVLPPVREVTGGDPFMAIVSYKDAPPPGWAMQVAGQPAMLGTYQAGPFKNVTPFAAMYLLYLALSHTLPL